MGPFVMIPLPAAVHPDPCIVQGQEPVLVQTLQPHPGSMTRSTHGPWALRDVRSPASRRWHRPIHLPFPGHELGAIVYPDRARNPVLQWDPLQGAGHIVSGNPATHLHPCLTRLKGSTTVNPPSLWPSKVWSAMKSMPRQSFRNRAGTRACRNFACTRRLKGLRRICSPISWYKRSTRLRWTIQPSRRNTA